MIRRPPRSTLSSSSAASDVYKRQRMKSPRMKNHNGALQLAQDQARTMAPLLELNLNLSMDQRRFGTSCGSIADMGNIIVPMSLSQWHIGPMSRSLLGILALSQVSHHQESISCRQWGELAGKVLTKSFRKKSATSRTTYTWQSCWISCPRNFGSQPSLAVFAQGMSDVW